ncbi:serine protein kinase RIO [Fodinicola acaciae]|uniref:serine protein kinase RIO n=1 Tax=Fodinicola acaciae TaxID=2681555 RepID=UPI0013D2AD6B|nr:RIO1 family regulatory kinase/ATPase [Fodinicola acaciae]
MRVPFRYDASRDSDDDLYDYYDAYDDPPVAPAGRRTRVEPPAGFEDAVAEEEEDADPDGPPEGDRWSTWDGASHGPKPWPDWLVTDLGAVDHELGVLKTGKEADVFLIRREVPGGRSCLLAAKRYRTAEHRSFRRDAGYLEGRRVKESRQSRAMARRTAYGRELIAGQWAGAEFGVLGSLWKAGLAVPYPVSLDYTEVLQEFIGSPSGEAAPRLAQVRPSGALLRTLWDQLLDAMSLMARMGLTHGDLSAYNLLVDGERLVMIDLPQAVDIVGNPQGVEFLHRDVVNVCEWFAARGLTAADPEAVLDLLRSEAHLT